MSEIEISDETGKIQTLLSQYSREPGTPATTLNLLWWLKTYTPFPGSRRRVYSLPREKQRRPSRTLVLVLDCSFKLSGVFITRRFAWWYLPVKMSGFPIVEPLTVSSGTFPLPVQTYFASAWRGKPWGGITVSKSQAVWMFHHFLLGPVCSKRLLSRNSHLVCKGMGLQTKFDAFSIMSTVWFVGRERLHYIVKALDLWSIEWKVCGYHFLNSFGTCELGMLLLKIG